MLSKYLLTLICLLSLQSYSYAYQKCDFKWSLKYNNISVGDTNETLYFSSNKYYLSYNFKPFKLAKSLGLPEVSSIASYNDNNYLKKEIKQHLFSTKQLIWKRKQNNLFTQENNKETKQIQLNENVPYIDLSIIPYLALVSDSVEENFYLLTQNDNPGIINAKLIKKNDSFILEYKKDNFIGFIYLDSKKNPTKFIVKNDNSNILGNLISSSCSEEPGNFDNLFK